MSTTTTTTMTQSRQVNGDIPSPAQQSAFLAHLLNYPIVSDGVHTFKANEYGQRSLQMGDSAYHAIYSTLAPWLTRPYEYVSPYFAKADTLGDQTLDKLDERFPVVKKPTNDIYNETKSFLLVPYQKGLESRDHLFKVYNNECKKNEQQGLVAHGKAAFVTALVLSNETLTWLSAMLKAKKEEAAQAVNEKANHH